MATKKLQCLLTGGANCNQYNGGASAMYASSVGARRGNMDEPVLFSIKADEQTYRDAPKDSSFYLARDEQPRTLLDNKNPPELRIQEKCMNCSTVDQNTFLTQCTGDTNVSTAMLKFAKCGAPNITTGTREVNQDQGNRQITSMSQRGAENYNLTDPSKGVDSTQGTSNVPGAGAMYAYGSTMYAHRTMPSFITPAATLMEGKTGSAFW